MNQEHAKDPQSHDEQRQGPQLEARAPEDMLRVSFYIGNMR